MKTPQEGRETAVKRDAQQPQEKMRVSFDLDEVLFVSPKTHKTEPPLKFPFNRIFKERLRLGTPDLIRSLQGMGLHLILSLGTVYQTAVPAVRRPL
jgi:hypothetical protein